MRRLRPTSFLGVYSVLAFASALALALLQLGSAFAWQWRWNLPSGCGLLRSLRLWLLAFLLAPASIWLKFGLQL